MSLIAFLEGDSKNFTEGFLLRSTSRLCPLGGGIGLLKTCHNLDTGSSKNCPFHDAVKGAPKRELMCTHTKTHKRN